MNPWLIGAIVLGVIALVGSGAAAGYSMLLRSGAASRLGIDNAPDDPEIADRLNWLASQVGPVLGLVHDLYPNARITSGYRNAEVNAAVGGHPNSYHQRGLAFDVGGIGSHGDIEAACRHIRDNMSALPVIPRKVLAEYDHIHLTYWDRRSGDCTFLTQTSRNPKQFGAMA